MATETTPRENVVRAGTEIAETGFAFVDGAIVPFKDAKVSIATHALQYGTAVFEGIRAYWNARQEQLFLFRVREHYERMTASAGMLRIAMPRDPDGLTALTIELLRKNDARGDTYIRPLAYKAALSIKVTLSGIRDGFAIYTLPIGAYLPTGGLAARTSSWRRIADTAIPARGKVTGSYANASLAVDEVHAAGGEEAVLLTEDGHVAEGGGANLFMLRGRELITPPVTDDILEGITRDSVMIIARDELGLEVRERSIDRTELYGCDELFFCGTGAQVAACVNVDGRSVRDGKIGPVTADLARRYIAIARGEDRAHPEWRTPVFG